MNEISFGAVSSPSDSRTFKDTALVAPNPSESYKTDISMLPVRYQEKLGVCMAEETCGYVEWLYFKKTGKYVRLSTAFLYIVTKLYIDKNFIEGSSHLSMLKAAQKYGICTEESFPTNYKLSHTDFLLKTIPAKAFTEALNYKIGAYFQIPVDVSLIRGAIKKYGLVALRMEVGKEWFTPSWKASEILPLKKPESVISGHAVYLYGYEPGNVFWLRNSWSANWAEGGNAFFDDDNYSPTEAWVATLNDPQEYKGTKFVTFDTIKKLLDVFRKIGIVN